MSDEAETIIGEIAESDVEQRIETTDDASDLADELARIEAATEGEAVRAEVTEVSAGSSDSVRLEVTLPHGTVATFELEKPVSWNESFLLVRIAEDRGYDSAASVQHLVGDEIIVERDGDDWELVDPWSWRDHARAWFGRRTPGQAVATLLGGLSGITVADWLLDQPDVTYAIGEVLVALAPIALLLVLIPMVLVAGPSPISR